MSALIAREQLGNQRKFLINPASRAAFIEDPLAVMVQFHVSSPIKESLDTHQRLNAISGKTLTDYKNAMKQSAQDVLTHHPKLTRARLQSTANSTARFTDNDSFSGKL